MNGITGFALNNSRTVVMTMVLVVIGGFYAFAKLPKLEDPLITIREAVVVAKFPGMPVENVERLITRPIEEAVGVIPGVRDLRSTSRAGISEVVLEMGQP